LFPNQFVNAKLIVDTLSNVTLIPTAAIQRNPQGAFVYVVTNQEVTLTNQSGSVHDQPDRRGHAHITQASPMPT
jgi:membrane fusion protein, multidrug efflux system